MNLEIENRRIFEAFDSLIYPLDASKVSMWSLTDRYDHPLFFRFKFKGITKEHPFYAKIKDAIEKYAGNVEWTISTTEKASNYVLVPKSFSEYVEKGVPFNKVFFLSIFKEEDYIKMIDLSISDVPSLAKAIRNIQ